MLNAPCWKRQAGSAMPSSGLTFRERCDLFLTTKKSRVPLRHASFAGMMAARMAAPQLRASAPDSLRGACFSNTAGCRFVCFIPLERMITILRASAGASAVSNLVHQLHLKGGARRKRGAVQTRRGACTFRLRRVACCMVSR